MLRVLTQGRPTGAVQSHAVVDDIRPSPCDREGLASSYCEQSLGSVWDLAGASARAGQLCLRTPWGCSEDAPFKVWRARLKSPVERKISKPWRFASTDSVKLSHGKHARARTTLGLS